MRSLEEIQKDLNNPLITDIEKQEFLDELSRYDHLNEAQKAINSFENKAGVNKVVEVVKKEKELIKLNETQQTTVDKFYENTDFKYQQDFLKVLIDSKQLPSHIRSVETAFTIAQMAKELNVPLMQGLNNIIPISGKLTLSAKLSSAILKRNENKIRYHTLKDAVYVYNIDGAIKESQFPLFPAGEMHSKTFICRMTVIETIRFYEKNAFYPQGQEIKELITYTTIDADKAELLSKDNWKKMPRAMLYARCMNEISTRIAPDITLGLMLTEVYADHENITLNLDTEGNYQSL